MKQDEFNFDAVTFSRPLSEAAKEAGMSLAVSSRRELLEAVRIALVQIALARESREVTAEDGQRWLIMKGYKPRDLGPAAGSRFHSDDWEFTGKWRKSERVSNHASDLRVWRLRG